MLLLAWADATQGAVDWAAWVEAIGSVGAIIGAIGLWRLDGRRTRERDLKLHREHLSRIITGLRAEVICARDASAMRFEVFCIMRKQAALVSASGRKTLADGTLPAESVGITDGVIYRAVASEMGILPRAIIESVVRFYNDVREFERLAAIPTNIAGIAQIMDDTMPRICMAAEILLATLNRFESAGFDPSIDLRFPADQMRSMAAKCGYDLSRAASERGIHL